MQVERSGETQVGGNEKRKQEMELIQQGTWLTEVMQSRCEQAGEETQQGKKQHKNPVKRIQHESILCTFMEY